jgi:hypothetical protein
VQNDEELAATLGDELEALRLQEIEDARLALRLSEIGEDTQEHEVEVRASRVKWWLPTLAKTADLWVIVLPGQHPEYIPCDTHTNACMLRIIATCRLKNLATIPAEQKLFKVADFRLADAW